MSYVLYVAFARVRKNLRQYLLVALQIAFGTAILYSALSMQNTASRECNELRNSMESGFISLVGVPKPDTVPISADDYYAILAEMPPSNIVVSYERWFYIYATIAEKQLQIPVFVVSDNYFKSLLGMKNLEPNTAYIGSELASNLAFGDFFINSMDLGIETKNMILGIPFEDYVLMDNNDFSQTAQTAFYNDTAIKTGGMTELSFDNAVIIPMSLCKYNVGISGTLYISVDKTSPDATEIYCKSVMDYLTMRHSNTVYQYTNPYQQLESVYKSKADTAVLLAVISFVLFSIITFGFIGLLLIVINKRKPALAICRMCGARIKHLYSELFLEVSIIVFSGAIIGIVFAIMLLPLQNSFLFVAQNSFLAMLQCTLGLLAVCITVSGAAIIKVARSSPIATVKSL